MPSEKNKRKARILPPPSRGGGGGHGGGSENFSDPLFFDDTTPVLGSVETPGKVTPDISFEMHFFNRDKTMPDGEEVEIWGFEDRLRPTEEKVVLPSSPIRVKEGDIVHVTIKPGKRQHTIHLHGIESDTHNDGVGHTSFEITGHYTYQWRAGAPFQSFGETRNNDNDRGAGTYLYHCHVNTTLHFQMGMAGALIVDPMEGPGTAFHNGPEYDVDSERIWVTQDIDPRWHKLNHAAGLSGGDAGLNDFQPKHFLITGVAQPQGGPPINNPAIATHGTVKRNGDEEWKPILIRFIHGSYTRGRVIFEGLENGIDVEVIASDGRAFDNMAPNFAKPFALKKDEPPEIATGERYDYLVTGKKPGIYPVRIQYLDWIRGDDLVWGEASTTITISELEVSIQAPASVKRGEAFDVTATVKNNGNTTHETASGLKVTLSSTPRDSLRLEGDNATQVVGDLSPSQQKSVSWRMRANDDGPATIKVSVENGSGTVSAASSKPIEVLN